MSIKDATAKIPTEAQVTTVFQHPDLRAQDKKIYSTLKQLPRTPRSSPELVDSKISDEDTIRTEAKELVRQLWNKYKK